MKSLIFVATVLITVAFWLALGPRSRVDAGGDYEAFYEPAARGLVTQGRLASADGSAPTRYPPGYPLILSFLLWLARETGLPEVAFRQAFALFSTAMSGVLLFLLARSVWPDRAAIVAALLWASCPFVLWISAIETTELAFCVFFYGACTVLWLACERATLSWWRFAIAGALIGCAMLIRPIAIGAGMVMALYVWFTWPARVPRVVRSAAVAAVLLGNLAAVLPWQVWVYQRYGQLIVLSDGGVMSVRDGLTYATNLKGFRRPAAVPSDVAAVMRAIEARYDELNAMGDVVRVLAEEAAVRPLGVVKLFGLKAARSWYGTDSHEREGRALALQSVYLTLILVGAVIAWRCGARTRRLLILATAFTVYFWVMTVVALSIVRYMVPAIGLMFVVTPGVAVAMRDALAGSTTGRHLSAA